MGILHFTLPFAEVRKMNSLILNVKLNTEILILCLDYYDLTRILLSNGSNVNAMNYDFEFPIHFAAKGEFHI